MVPRPTASKTGWVMRKVLAKEAFPDWEKEGDAWQRGLGAARGGGGEGGVFALQEGTDAENWGDHIAHDGVA